MSNSLQKRIYALVHQVLDSYPGVWMVWCDPRGDWTPLLQRVANDTRMGGFRLVQVNDWTAGELGGPLARAELQQRLEASESFVLLVPAASDNLGWLWAQALLAECIYTRSLREQLLDWGWRPHSLTISDDEVAVLARQYLQQDPADWGGGGLQPDIPLLLEVLAGGAEPQPDNRMILDLTIEQAGLPVLDEQNLFRWRSRSLARLLVTQAFQVAPKLVGEDHELLIPAERRAFALHLLDSWLDSLRLSKGLPEAVLEADRIAVLGSQMGEATAKHGPFLSHAAERAVFANTCVRLAQKSGKELLQALAVLRDDLARHDQNFWGSGCSHRQAIAWDELLRLSQAAQTLLDASPVSEWAAPEAAIAWYIGGGWRVDQAGEELLRHLQKPAPELLTVITSLRTAYRARWERYLMHWSDLWTSAGCPMPDISSAGEWLHDLLGHRRPTAILIVDALRYDLGATLTERLNQQEGAERASVHPGRAPLPSITAIGMGMALPIPERDLEADIVDGKWHVRQVGNESNLSMAAQRRAWWQEQGKVPADALLTLTTVQAGDLPSPSPQRTRLVIFDDTIDKLGHDDELEAMGSGMILDRYLTAIGRLRDVGWLRILIVTDHGFIHWASTEEKNVAPPAPNPVYSSRRALAYPKSVSFAGPHALAPGERWRVAVPRGASSFRAYGGLGYFHGGASLQEWIIPCIQIEWPLQARPVEVEIQPLAHILTQRPRVTLLVVRSSLLIEDAIPRQVDVVIRDAHQHTILFRSAPLQITPDQDQVTVAVPLEEDQTAARGTPLRIEVRDRRTEEVIATSDSTLMTELTGW